MSTGYEARTRDHEPDASAASHCRRRAAHARQEWRYACVVYGFRTWREALQAEWRVWRMLRRCRSIEARRAAMLRALRMQRWASHAPRSADVEPTRYGYRAARLPRGAAACADAHVDVHRQQVPGSVQDPLPQVQLVGVH